MDISEVLPGLYLSGIAVKRASAPCRAALAVTDYDMGAPAWAERYLWVELCDTESEPEAMFRDAAERGATFLAECARDGVPVCVYCGLGVSRSPAVLCWYLVRERGLSVDSALRLVKERRPKARPNFGFQRYLRRMEAERRE